MGRYEPVLPLIQRKPLKIVCSAACMDCNHSMAYRPFLIKGQNFKKLAQDFRLPKIETVTPNNPIHCQTGPSLIRGHSLQVTPLCLINQCLPEVLVVIGQRLGTTRDR